MIKKLKKIKNCPLLAGIFGYAIVYGDGAAAIVSGDGE